LTSNDDVPEWADAAFEEAKRQAEKSRKKQMQKAEKLSKGTNKATPSIKKKKMMETSEEEKIMNPDVDPVLLEQIKEDERELRRYEKLLGLKKGKKSAKFAEENLDCT